MPTGVRDLGIYEIGKETTKGTAVAGTTRLVADVMVKPEEKTYQPQPQIGIMLDNPTSDMVVSRMAKINWKGDLTYEQILHLLSMSVDGAQTGTGAGADKTWTFASLYTADPILDSFTLRKRVTDGTTTWDEVLAYVLCESFKLSGAIGEAVKFDATLFSRPLDTSLVLSGAAVPAVNFVSSADTKVFIDDTFAGLGTTQLLGDIIGWEFNLEAQYQAKMFQDGRADRSFSSHGLKRQKYSATLQCEYNAPTHAERSKAALRTVRYVRIVNTGAVLGASNYQIQIDFAARHATAMPDADGERDGNDTITLPLISAFDTTNLIGCKFTIVNALAALP